LPHPLGRVVNLGIRPMLELASAARAPAERI
jgi:hypothetical protein